MYGWLIGTHQRSFNWYHLRPPIPFLEIGSLQLSNPLLSQEQVKLQPTDFKFGGNIYRVNPNKSPLKIQEKMERGRIQGLPKLFLGNPYYLRNGLSYGLQILYDYSQGRSEQKPMKNVGISSRGRIQTGSPENFQGTHVQGALRGHLCDSTAFLFLLQPHFPWSTSVRYDTMR